MNGSLLKLLFEEKNGEVWHLLTSLTNSNYYQQMAMHLSDCNFVQKNFPISNSNYSFEVSIAIENWMRLTVETE